MAFFSQTCLFNQFDARLISYLSISFLEPLHNKAKENSFSFR